MSPSPFAALLGQQYVPDTKQPAGRRHLIDPEASAHLEVSRHPTKKVKPPKVVKHRAPPPPPRRPNYTSITERTMCILKLMLDGKPRTRRQIAEAIGCGEPENIANWLNAALDTGVFVSAGRPTPSERRCAGQVPTLLRLNLPVSE